jgi:hypothetical protein
VRSVAMGWRGARTAGGDRARSDRSNDTCLVDRGWPSLPRRFFRMLSGQHSEKWSVAGQSPNVHSYAALSPSHLDGRGAQGCLFGWRPSAVGGGRAHSTCRAWRLGSPTLLPLAANRTVVSPVPHGCRQGSSRVLTRGLGRQHIVWTRRHHSVRHARLTTAQDVRSHVLNTIRRCGGRERRLLARI